MSYRFLIVDDTNFMRKMAADCLKQNGYEVAGEAANGREAIQLYEELRPDIVMMDLTMPEMNGIDALKEILKINPEAVVLICSASHQQDLIFDAMEAGAKGYLMKPFNPNRLVEVIHSHAVPFLNLARSGNAEETPQPIAPEESPIVMEDSVSAIEPSIPASVYEFFQPDSAEQLIVATVELPEQFAELPTTRANEKMRSFVSSINCSWQEDIQGETTQFKVTCTECDNQLLIEMSSPSHDKQVIPFTIDGFRQLSDWLESQTGTRNKNMAQA
jgi:CheY-like chemotaxis protein